MTGTSREARASTGPAFATCLGLAVAATAVAAIASTAGTQLAGATLAVVLAVAVVGVPVSSVAARRPPQLSPADVVTLARAVGVGACAAILVSELTTTTGAGAAADPRSWLLLAVAAPALALDAVDGAVARRTSTASPAGARLDVDADAVALLVLSGALVPLVGWWVLAIGLTYPAFLAVALVRPAWRAPLRPDPDRRRVAALQAVVLGVALAPVVPVPAAAAITAAGTGLLLASFARDAAELERADAVVVL